MTEWIEKSMTLDGIPLEVGDVMTIRVALSSFFIDLSEDLTPEDLGPIHGLYLKRTRNLLYRLSGFQENRENDDG